MDKKYKRVLVTIIAGAVLIFAFYFITGSITKYTGYLVSEESKQSDFEKCLIEKDIELYINSANSYETLNRMNVKDNLDKISIKNCLNDNMYCLEKNVTNFPTWIINGEKFERDLTDRELGEISGCGVYN